MYFGTAYGKPIKVEVLGKEALALIECDKIDKAERESESVSHNYEQEIEKNVNSFKYLQAVLEDLANTLREKAKEQESKN